MTDEQRAAAEELRGAPVHERVEFIADLMACGAYRTRLTVRELAPIWDLADQTVANLASEAGRTFRIAPEEKAAKQAENAAWFMARSEEAARRENILTGLPDMASALKARELYGKYAGLEPTEADVVKPAPARIVIAFEGEADPADVGPTPGTEPPAG